MGMNFCLDRIGRLPSKVGSHLLASKPSSVLALKQFNFPPGHDIGGARQPDNLADCRPTRADIDRELTISEQTETAVGVSPAFKPVELENMLLFSAPKLLNDLERYCSIIIFARSLACETPAGVQPINGYDFSMSGLSQAEIFKLTAETKILQPARYPFGRLKSPVFVNFDMADSPDVSSVFPWSLDRLTGRIKFEALTVHANLGSAEKHRNYYSVLYQLKLTMEWQHRLELIDSVDLRDVVKEGFESSEIIIKRLNTKIQVFGSMMSTEELGFVNSLKI